MKVKNDTQTTKALRAIVRGRVQGVGFRYFAMRAARELGVAGRVRNLPDGGVEAVATGTEPALREFLAALGRGPSFSRVASVDAEWLDAVPEYGSFEVGF